MSEQEQPQQPTFPQTGVQVTPQGVVVTAMLTPTLQITQLIPEDAMNQIAGKWLESRRELRKELQLIQDINASKGRENLQLIKPGLKG